VIDGYVQFAGDVARSVVLTPLGHTVLHAHAPVATKLAAD
jgi:hypothetical protein